MLALIVAFVLGSGGNATVVQGTVRATDDGAPVAGALIEVVGGVSSVRSDSAGVYALTLPSPGTFHLRVTRLGFASRTLDVVVGESALTVDVALVPKAFPLAEITVRPADGWHRADPDGSNAWTEPGMISLSGADLHANAALASSDVLRALASTGYVSGIPELMSSLHVRGGSSDQNVVTVDGIPVYNPYHGGGTLTAINPDAVSSVTLHGPVPAPQFGGALSSVVEIRTDQSRPTRLTTYGAMDPSGVRQTVAAPLPWREGSLLVSARRSLSELYPAGNGQPRSTSYSDFLGRTSLRLGAGTLELLALGSTDQLAFESRVLSQSATAVDNQWPAPTAARNQFNWSTGTQAVVWSAEDGAKRWQLRAWHSSFTGASSWSRDSSPVRLSSDWSSIGIGALTGWRWGSTELSAGGEAQRVHDSYLVTAQAGAPRDTTHAPLTLGSQHPLVSFFLQGSRELAPRWTLVAGLRDLVGSSAWQQLEPRFALQFRASPALALSAGFARLHQQSQSLRNEESLLDGIVGIALPVTNSVGGVPAGTSDQVALSLDADVGAGVELRLDGYLRQLRGLVLVAPSTGQPFATGAFEIGSGRASGAGLSLRRRGERLSWTARYAVENTTRSARSQSYDPGFGISRSLNATAAVRLGSHTIVRSELWGASGRPSSVSLGAFDWTSSPILHGAGTLAGSPQQIAGALGDAQLPAYWRLDLGVRHEWQLGVLGSTAAIAATVGVINVFDRTNTMALVQTTVGAPQQPIGLSQRSLVFALEWRY